jgi:DHA1 family bicyclomycin/chloramphenicol resistance-like MFS transporter
VDRIDPRRIVRLCMSVQFVAALALVPVAASGAPRWLLALPIFVVVTTVGAIMGNGASLAMEPVRTVAGTGSAVLGFLQFGLGAAASPIVGLGGDDSAVVPAIVMATASLVAWAVSRLLRVPNS